jgi:thymidylate synthase
MAGTYFSGETLDDVMRSATEAIVAHGDRTYPTKGEALELSGVLLEITNPRARLSRTESRGKLYSPLGELCWYLAKSNELGFISYYIKEYAEYADGNEIFGGYGPRFFDWKGVNQIANIIELLKRNRYSRKAVIQLFDRHDILEEHRDIPCTCTLQLMPRRDELLMICNMRSNDAHKGLPHDVFCFTMLQEITARTLSLEIGTYKHSAGSLHLYAKDLPSAQQLIGEGWQATIDVAMPEMPKADPWPAIALLLKAEFAIRTAGVLDEGILDVVDPYWADLIRLLQVFGHKKTRNVEKIHELRERIVAKVYLPFIDKFLGDGA